MTSDAITKNQAQRRNANIELGRVCCCFSIVIVHVFLLNHDHKVTSFVWSIAKCSASTVFFLISGYFFSDTKPFNVYMSRLLYRIIMPMILLMLVIAQLSPWLTAKSTLSQCLGTLNTDALINAYKGLISFNHMIAILPGYTPFFHLWFTYNMIKCYFMFPVLKLICADNDAARSVKKYLLWFGFFYFVFYHSLLLFFPSNEFIKLLSLPKLTSLNHFYWLWTILVGYQLGIYFKKSQTLDKLRPIILSSTLIVYILCGSILFLLTQNLGLINGHWRPHFFDRAFIFYVLPQLGFFIFFIAVKIKSQTISRIILFISDKTFYIYLVHAPLIFAILKHFKLTRFSFLTVCLVFLLSLFIACILKKTERLIGSAWVYLRTLKNQSPLLRGPGLS